MDDFEDFGEDVRPFLLGGADFLDADGDDGLSGVVEENTTDTRDYLLTAGRADGGRAGVRIETVVIRSQEGERRRSRLGLGPEQQAILEVAAEGPSAVAEIASRVGVSLGVARVLVGDLVADGLLIQSDSTRSVLRDELFLERLWNGVNSL